MLVLSILFGCVTAHSALALSLQEKDAVEGPVSLGGHLAVLYDPSGALTIDDIAAAGSAAQFRPIPAMLTEGYRSGAIWVRFFLSAPPPDDGWLLQIERPLIEQVTVYVPDGTGQFTTATPGRIHRGTGEGADAYPTIFPIAVPPTEAAYYVRLQSSTSITTSLNVWQRDGYEKYRRSDHWIMGLVLGAIGAIFLANLLFAYLLRDSLYLLYAAVLVVSALMTVFHLGYADEVLRFWEPAQIQRSWGIVVCLYSLVMVWFMGRLFEFRRHSIWAWRAIQLIVLLNVGAMIFAIVGRYGDVGLFVSRLQQYAYIFIAVFVLYLLFVRRQYRYIPSAVAFGGVIGVSLVMQSQYTGANLFGLDTSLARFMAIGTLIHLVLLSAAVAQRARQAELDLSGEKDRAIALSRSAEQELTLKVHERTAELATANASLKEEMEQRQLLEVKLRQSLESVNEALAQQRNLIAFVSHEFRAPLAVIDAAAGNLSMSAAEGTQDFKLRTAKIRQTVSRMTMLIDNVLVGERLDAGHAAFSTIETLDLNEVLDTIEAGLDGDGAARVSFTHGGKAPVKGDRTLLEIIVLNLLQNALKYSPAPNKVTVRLSEQEGTVFVDVTDRGFGIQPDERELIFMKYYRTAGQRVNGSGLGLYIAREVARQHGGDLILAASDDRGSTFRLSLPKAETAAAGLSLSSE